MIVLVPIWKRPEITELCFLGLDRLRQYRDLEILAIISEDSFKSRCLKHDIRYTFFENILGAKKNHGLQEALKLEWDYLLEINSDDLIKNELLDVYDSMTDDFIGLQNFCFMNSKTKEVRQVASNTMYGIGRRYSRQSVERAALCTGVTMKESLVSDMRLLERGNRYDVPPAIADDLEKSGRCQKGDTTFKLWDDKAMVGMDNHARMMMKKSGYNGRLVFTDEPLAVDIKSDVNIWKWNPDAGVPYPYEELINGLSDKEIECLEQI